MKSNTIGSSSIPRTLQMSPQRVDALQSLGYAVVDVHKDIAVNEKLSHIASAAVPRSSQESVDPVYECQNPQITGTAIYDEFKSNVSQEPTKDARGLTKKVDSLTKETHKQSRTKQSFEYFSQNDTITEHSSSFSSDPEDADSHPSAKEGRFCTEAEDAKKGSKGTLTRRRFIKWEERLEELREYKRMHGHCNVPQALLKKNRLGFWVNSQRTEFKRWRNGRHSSLTPARIKDMNEVGFVWNIQDISWQEKVEQLRIYREEHGNCNVPKRFPENAPLGNWVHWQRTQYKLFSEGKPSSMTETRISTLNLLGFSWTCRKQKATSVCPQPALKVESDEESVLE